MRSRIRQANVVVSVFLDGVVAGQLDGIREEGERLQIWGDRT